MCSQWDGDGTLRKYLSAAAGAAGAAETRGSKLYLDKWEGAMGEYLSTATAAETRDSDSYSDRREGAM